MPFIEFPLLVLLPFVLGKFLPSNACFMLLFKNIVSGAGTYRIYVHILFKPLSKSKG